MSHELLHTHRQYVSVGDRVVAGQMVGTMGNMGVREKYVESGDHHLHYQLIDAAGRRLDPQSGVLAGVNQAPQGQTDTPDNEDWSAMWRRRSGLP